jgi:hypothetical protein
MEIRGGLRSADKQEMFTGNETDCRDITRPVNSLDKLATHGRIPRNPDLERMAFGILAGQLPCSQVNSLWQVYFCQPRLNYWIDSIQTKSSHIPISFGVKYSLFYLVARSIGAYVGVCEGWWCEQVSCSHRAKPTNIRENTAHLVCAWGFLTFLLQI